MAGSNELEPAAGLEIRERRGFIARRRRSGQTSKLIGRRVDRGCGFFVIGECGRRRLFFREHLVHFSVRGAAVIGINRVGMNFLRKGRWFSSLRKTQQQIPGGIWGARMWIDHPANHVVIQDEITRIAGWFYCEEPPSELTLRLADQPLECIEIDRPDVARIYPDGVSRGFCTFVDLSKYLEHRGRESLSFSFFCGDRLLLSKDFQIHPEAWQGAERLPEVRRRKRQWLIEHFSISSGVRATRTSSRASWLTSMR